MYSRGSGILAAMEADFCTQEILLKVKAVHRNLHTTDLRQVICYLIAGLGSRQFAWVVNTASSIRDSLYITTDVSMSSFHTPADARPMSP